MSRSTEYELNLLIASDKANDTLRDVEQKLKKIADNAKKSDMFDGLDRAQESAKELQAKMKELSKETHFDLDSFVAAYKKGAMKAINELEKQYAKLSAQKSEGDALTAKKQDLIKYIEKEETTEEEKLKLTGDLKGIEEKLASMRYKDIEGTIKKNRQLRLSIKVSEKETRIDAIKSRISDTQLKKEELKKKSILSRFPLITKERRELDKTIKQYKQQLEMSKAVEKQQKKNSKFLASSNKNIGGTAQGLYNVFGLVGGAQRVARGAGRMGVGAAKMIGSAASAVVQSADKEVEKENAARRIKGSLSNDEKKAVMGELYLKTGADYSTIVEAIGRVQSVLGASTSPKSLIEASVAELNFPGAAAMFRQQNSGEKIDSDLFMRYFNRMRAIQSETGASQEQISASTEKIANLRQSSFSNAKMSDLQAIYLSLENSGAYDNAEELDRAFRAFVRSHNTSIDGAFEHAKAFDWERYADGATNKQQVNVALGNVDWDQLGSAASTNDGTYKQTHAETLAEHMRQVEERKNELLMKLIPALMPLVDELLKVLVGNGARNLIRGISEIFSTVAPMLAPVFKLLNKFLDFFNTYILENLRAALTWLAKKFGSGGDETGAIPQSANGGIAFGPTLVGERRFQPEMIVPLDYSRNARASNIISNVSQTFNLSGTETTALSLAQAVRSRDFHRATTQSNYLVFRGGIG